MRCRRSRRPSVFSALLALSLAPGAPGLSAAEDPAAPAGPSAFLALLQDSSPSGLVPWDEGNDRTDVFANVIAAMVFVREGRYGRARRIFDALMAQGDPCPGIACGGALQDSRLVATGAPYPALDRNDYWIGAQAFLLSSLKQYELATQDGQYGPFVARLESWFQCLEALTPDPGIFAGFDRQCQVMAQRHPEGSIDVFGSLRGSPPQFEAVRASIKAWIDAEVWVPDGHCFEPGPAIAANVPADLVSFGVPALGADYGCLLRHAERLHFREQDRHVIETFDRHSLWTKGSAGGVTVDVQAERSGSGHELVVRYSTVGPGQDWWVVNRQTELDLHASPGFRLRLRVKGNGQPGQIDVKLRNRSGEVYWVNRPAPATGWQILDFRYADFVLFSGGPQPAPLGPVVGLEVGFNTGGQPRENELRLGRISSFDDHDPFRYPVEGFAAWEHEDNWLFVEGSAAMAAAYCRAGEEEAWKRQVRALAGLRTPGDGIPASGLPSWVSGGIENPRPTALGTAWFLLARGCVPVF